jgi:hypothetical protein
MVGHLSSIISSPFVKLVTGQKHVATKPALKDKLAQLRANLVSALLHSLSDQRQRKSQVIHLATYLGRLQSTPQARAAFLAARGELIRKRIRMIPLEGDIPLYIFDLAIIVFTAIKHTAEWFLAAFKENESTSCKSLTPLPFWFVADDLADFVEWCKEQIENYCEMYKKQLDSTEDPKVLTECAEITRQQSKRVSPNTLFPIYTILTWHTL